MTELPPDRAAADSVPRLPLTRYRLRFAASDAKALAGRQLGSAWRGAFGRALRRSVCITNLPTCDTCALLDHCVYPRTFEKRTPPDAEKLRLYPTTPNPYVLAPADERWDSADKTTNLGVTLFGAANEDAPTILQASRTAAEAGLTGRRIELAFVDAEAEAPTGSVQAWTKTPSSGGLGGSSARVVTPPEPLAPPAAVRVRLLSPLRIRADGRYVGPDRLEFRAFAANLLRRVSLLTHFFGERPWSVDFAGLLQQAADVRVTERQLRWREGTRHSSRQQARIPMGGIVGSFVAEGAAIGALWPCLWLGQWTHIGKGCTMGLGRYVVEPPGPASGESWPSPALL